MAKDINGKPIELGDWIAWSRMPVVLRVIELSENLAGVEIRGGYVAISDKNNPKIARAWLDIADCTLVMKADGTLV